MVHYRIDATKKRKTIMDGGKQTDWTRYYRTSFVTAHLLRRITSGRLLAALKRAGFVPEAGFAVELGGGGSSFAARLVRCFRFREYGVIDTNDEGLRRFLDLNLPCLSRVEKKSVLDEKLPDWQADLVFSAGLIEHFSPVGTAQAVRAHFALAKPGGTVAILFPENTALYRFVRRILEHLGLWSFPDERPLSLDEVIRAAGCDPCVSEGIRIILLTQRLLVFRRINEADERCFA